MVVFALTVMFPTVVDAKFPNEMALKTTSLPEDQEFVKSPVAEVPQLALVQVFETPFVFQ
jgi:hypothetical protein